MSAVVDLFRQAADLAEGERAALAGLLIESLESEHEHDVGVSWVEEIERRLAELDSGSVKPVPWEEVRSRLIRPRRAS